jgi:hypothetical protein
MVILKAAVAPKPNVTRYAEEETLNSVPSDNQGLASRTV